MNPNPDETSPASGRQQSKSLEEIATDAAIKLARNPLYRESTYAIILRALQSATAESEEKLKWIRDNCKVIYFPLTPEGDSPSYPIEHTMASNKDMWETLLDAARQQDNKKSL